MYAQSKPKQQQNDVHDRDFQTLKMRKRPEFSEAAVENLPFFFFFSTILSTNSVRCYL